MAPGWVEILSYISLSLAVLSSLIIVADILAGRRQHMPVMNLVWVVTAWYLGPLGLWFYWTHGRRMSKPIMMQMMREQGKDPQSGDMHEKMKEMMQQMAGRQSQSLTAIKGALHCGTGCMLGDIAAEWTVFATGFAIAGSEFVGRLVLVLIFAYLLGIVIQYKTIAPIRGESLGPGLISAVKADTLSLFVFEIGMFAWMALTHYVLFTPPLKVPDPAFWFMMQIAMVCGVILSSPVNSWLVNKGLKERM